MTNILTADADLAAVFGLDFDNGVDQATAPATVLCAKCNGRGNFIGYTGRVVGKCFTCNGSGLRADDARPNTEINVGAIETAFATATSNGIKRPKLRLASFVFSRAPDTGRNAGSIYVKQGQEYLGKVSAGRFYPVRTCDDATRDSVVSTASDPHAAAKAYGLKTGECSCCGRELTNKESIELGIGPRRETPPPPPPPCATTSSAGGGLGARLLPGRDMPGSHIR